jgi:tetratricopeptide (TPR) repeat protein
LRPRQALAAWLALALAVLAAYWPVRGHGYVEYDDPVYVRDNPHVAAGLDGDAVTWAFSSGHAANYHPLTWLSHQLDVTLFGLDAPGAMHLVNLLLHLGNTLLVGLLARRLGLPWAAAWLSALLFGLHPLRVESVAWISERKDVLCAFFFLAALVAYVDQRGTRSAWRWSLVLALTLLALLAKPMAVTLPVVMCLIDLWAPTPTSTQAAMPSPAPTHPGVTNGPRRGLAIVLEKWPLGLLVLASATVTWMVQSHGGATSALDALPTGLRALNALAAVKDYVVRTVWPTDLAVFYPHVAIVSESPAQALLLPALAGLALVLTAILVAARAWGPPLVRLGLAWFGVTLLPVIGLVQVGTQASADRYAYLPSIGLALAASAVLARRPARTALASGVVLGVPLALATHAQVGHWSDTRTLFEHARGVTEHNYLAESKLGELALAEGRLEVARTAFMKALEIHPQDLDALVNLALLERQLGRPELALQLLQRARARAPEDPNVMLNLAVVKLDAGELDRAEELLQACLERSPDLADAHFDLGLVAQGRNLPQLAEQRFRAALAIDPRHVDAWSNLGQVLLLQERLPESIEAFERGVALDPADPLGHFNLSVVHARGGDVAAARRDLQRALELDPGFELARQRLAELSPDGR